MNELIRRAAFEAMFDDMLKGFLVRPFAGGLAPELSGGIRVDVKEDDAAYTVHAELPGVSKEDIHVEVDGNRVSISAEVKRQSEQKEGEKVIRSERYYGEVSRAFTLAQDVDEAGARAQYKDGVLELTLPKRAPGATRKLTVE